MGLLDKALKYKKKLKEKAAKRKSENNMSTAISEAVDELEVADELEVKQVEELEELNTSVKEVIVDEEITNNLENKYAKVESVESVGEEESNSDLENENIEELNVNEEFIIEDQIEHNQSISIEENINELEKEKDQKKQEEALEKELKQNLEQEKLAEKSKKEFQDSLVLYELSKEIIKSNSYSELFDITLFAIMGQIGSSSASIIGPVNFASEKPVLKDETKKTLPNKWEIKEKQGVKLKADNISFKTNERILKDLIDQKELIDIEKYKVFSDCKNEYFTFLSIDTRIICPINLDGEVIAAVCIGEKITIGDYSDEEKKFIKSICEMFSINYKKLSKIQFLSDENIKLKKHEKQIISIEKYEKFFKKFHNDDYIEKHIRIQMNSFDVDSYAFFVKNDKESCYEIKFNDTNDLMGLKKANFKIAYNNPFVTFLKKVDTYQVVESPLNSSVLENVFDSSYLIESNYFAVCPYVLVDNLTGFLILFKVNLDTVLENKHEIIYFAKTVYSYLLGERSYNQLEGKYIDNIDLMFNRVNNDLENSVDLKIPLTLVLLSIKNYKRYISLFGGKQTSKLMNSVGNIIKSRLSEIDYSYRYDRNKMLLVLPGKNKKYAIPLANAIKNELSEEFNNSEFQILLSYLIAEYPVDGETLAELFDCID